MEYDNQFTTSSVRENIQLSQIIFPIATYENAPKGSPSPSPPVLRGLFNSSNNIVNIPSTNQSSQLPTILANQSSQLPTTSCNQSSQLPTTSSNQQKAPIASSNQQITTSSNQKIEPITSSNQQITTTNNNVCENQYSILPLDALSINQPLQHQDTPLLTLLSSSCKSDLVLAAAQESFTSLSSPPLPSYVASSCAPDTPSHPTNPVHSPSSPPQPIFLSCPDSLPPSLPPPSLLLPSRSPPSLSPPSLSAPSLSAPSFSPPSFSAPSFSPPSFSPPSFSPPSFSPPSISPPSHPRQPSFPQTSSQTSFQQTFSPPSSPPPPSFLQTSFPQTSSQTSFQQTSFQQTSFQQTSFQQTSFQQTPFQQTYSSPPQSSFLQTSSPQTSSQQTRRYREDFNNKFQAAFRKLLKQEDAIVDFENFHKTRQCLRNCTKWCVVARMEYCQLKGGEFAKLLAAFKMSDIGKRTKCECRHVTHYHPCGN